MTEHESNEAAGEPGWKKLKAWEAADDLAVQAVSITRQLKNVEFSLLGQINRAAVSVPANIVEGYSRLSLREYLHHLSIARASLAGPNTSSTSSGASLSLQTTR
jgi:hypothetical protein